VNGANLSFKSFAMDDVLSRGTSTFSLMSAIPHAP
jgi:hypothetical protein